MEPLHSTRYTIVICSAIAVFISIVFAQFIQLRFSPFYPFVSLLDRNFPYGNFSLKDSVLTNGFKLKIPLPPPLGPDDRKNFSKFNIDLMTKNMPIILEQFNFSQDQIQIKVGKGVELVYAAVEALAASHGHRTNSSIHALAFWDEVGDFFGDFACGVVAGVGLPFFLSSAAIFAAENDGLGRPITPDQSFYIFPLYGDIATSGPLRVFYTATRPVLFDSAIGSTYNRDIYTVYDAAPVGDSPNFSRNIRLLLHEIQHTMQYRALGYDLLAFGYSYLFKYCKTGGYSNMPQEIEAKSREHLLDQLLLEPDPFTPPPAGTEFFRIWRTRWLSSALGFPIATTYTSLSIPGKKIIELPFQYGLMQIDLTDPTRSCFRTFNSAEVGTMDAAKCTKLPKCKHHVKADDSAAMKKDTDGPNPREPCDPTDVKNHNNECASAKAQWSSLNGRAWTCESAPPPPPSPPPPAPDCPPDCVVRPRIPHSSHSCMSDNPPDGCDWESISECKERWKKCR